MATTEISTDYHTLSLHHALPIETGLGRFRPRRLAMLSGAYEFQGSMLAGASAMAGVGAELLNNPANPFAYFGGGPVMGSALVVFAHASAPRGKPDFGLTSTAIDGKLIASSEERR